MPFYEYECDSCKHYVEALQKISEPPLRKCPSCNKQTLRRLMSAPVFRLKGSGWYETDFKSDKEEKRNLATSDEAAESKADGKGDGQSKPAAKSESKPAEVRSERSGKKTLVSKSSAKAPARPAKAAKPKARAKAAPKKKKAARR
ncbi:MAG TPA: zinc ribbon domain-containing protein [Steroidobacteraceae bacterium]|jgi:putative FmdB family regulatory protein